ncbi:hypothetical protein QBC45DRAFT_396117 [Copromyces sp. CBS 386.78]|nr:hypothetical protein QBC45DRAFT_396117 [Copromyces sp. CBS 386.78]
MHDVEMGGMGHDDVDDDDGLVGTGSGSKRHAPADFEGQEGEQKKIKKEECKTKDVTLEIIPESVTVGGYLKKVCERVFEDCGRPTCERSKACPLEPESEKRQLKFLEAWKPEDGFKYDGGKEDEEKYLLEQEEKEKKKKKEEQQGQGQGQ